MPTRSPSRLRFRACSGLAGIGITPPPSREQLGRPTAYWPRMKALGGCSAMNAMIYIRGNGADYDAWRDRYGAAAGYERAAVSTAQGNTRLGASDHGRQGAAAHRGPTGHPRAEPGVGGGGGRRGAEPTGDLTRRLAGGCRADQVTCKRARRWSAADAYPAPAMAAPPVARTGAQATRIVREGAARSAWSTAGRGREQTRAGPVPRCCWPGGAATRRRPARRVRYRPGGASA